MHLVATCDELTILEGLQRGFPHLFTEDPMIGIRAPFSVVLAEVEKHSFEEYQKERYVRIDREFSLCFVLHLFKIPMLYGSGDQGGDDNIEKIPLSVIHQLIGQTATSKEMRVVYQDIECIVADISFEGDLKEEEIVGTVLTQEVVRKIDGFRLTPAYFFDFDK
jgi:hypothetical protein